MDMNSRLPSLEASILGSVGRALWALICPPLRRVFLKVACDRRCARSEALQAAVLAHSFCFSMRRVMSAKTFRIQTALNLI